MPDFKGDSLLDRRRTLGESLTNLGFCEPFAEFLELSKRRIRAAAAFCQLVGF